MVYAADNGSNAFGSFPLQLCQADCDDDDDCDVGLYCFVRDSKEAVPGCSGEEESESGKDYCAAIVTVPSSSPTSIPTSSPTAQPTNIPTSQPTNIPTSQPTNILEPTVSPPRCQIVIIVYTICMKYSL